MYNITELAGAFNFAHNSGNPQSGNYASILLNEVNPRHQGGRALINLSPNDCQCVGLAFTNIALGYDFGDQDINSVAAENAFYCLAKSFISKGNTYVTPAIFTLMQKGQNLLKDKLISSWCDLAQKEVGMPIGMMLGGNPFVDPRLKDFRQQAINFRYDIAYYALIQFFNIESKQYKIPTDLHCYFIPSEREINGFLKDIQTNTSYNSVNFENTCKKHFESVFEQCKNTLLQY